MRKPAFCICKYKGADQRLFFHYIDSTVHLLLLFNSAAQFVSDLVGNLKDRFSRNAALI